MEFFGDRLGSKLSKVSIGYLEETATRMGRKDVIHIAIGILANASSTRELFQFKTAPLEQCCIWPVHIEDI